MTTTNDSAALQSRHQTLQAELASRESTVQFARSGVSMIAALIVASSAGKLFWDAHDVLGFAIGVVASVIALSLSAYSVRRYLVGRKTLAHELARFAEFEAVRRELKLDDPASLLPRA